jgi:hypothetical protein
VCVCVCVRLLRAWQLNKNAVTWHLMTALCLALYICRQGAKLWPAMNWPWPSVIFIVRYCQPSNTLLCSFLISHAKYEQLLLSQIFSTFIFGRKQFLSPGHNDTYSLAPPLRALVTRCTQVKSSQSTRYHACVITMTTRTGIWGSGVTTGYSGWQNAKGRWGPTGAPSLGTWNTKNIRVKPSRYTPWRRLGGEV